MKNIKYYIGLIIVGILSYSCQDDDHDFGEVVAPSNLTVEATVVNSSEENPYGDGSGMVEFTASADNALNYKYTFGDNSSASVTDGNTTHRFTSTGINEYVVTVIATGTGGASTSETVSVMVYSEFDDPETTALLTGGASKTWYVASALPGHLGLGPVEGTTPEWYSAAPFEKEAEGCFYNDAITFSLDDSGNIVFEHDNQGETFFNVDNLSAGGGSGSSDQCLPYDTSGQKFVNLAAASSIMPEEETTGTQMIITDGGFMSYYLSSSSYEILEIEEDYMYLRTPSGSTSEQAWYLKFTTDPEGGAGNTEDLTELETEFETLVWSDEFDQGASPDTSIWNYETGNNNGWGNGEAQYYTEDNAVIEEGILKINAIAESINGFDYSSSRITTKDNYEFQYGRIEVRAKLPDGGGTWPAIWMLGANYPDVEWPACGEIDIMEHVGNDPGLVHGTLHFPENFGGNAVTESTSVENVSSEFHTYTVEWTAEHILFAVDDMVYHEFENSADTPFHQPFFIILNVAMGGTLGGTIESDFQQATMEIDYVRVYQE